MIRTLVIDDQNIIREGIKVLLKNSTEIELVGFAEDGETAIEKVEGIQPNVVLLDINLPGIDGLTVADQIGTRFPQIKIIMLSSCDDEDYVRKAMASSAKGYLLKNVSSQELEWSIKLVHQGYSAFNSELLESLSQDLQDAPTATKTTPELEAVTVQNGAISASAPQPNQDSDELELLLARNKVRKKYSMMKQKRRNLGFHDVNMSRTKKTMMSFEFKLLVLITLFFLGLLVFYALS